MQLLPAIALLGILSLTAVIAAQSPDYTGDKNWAQVCGTAKSQPIADPQLDAPLAADKLAACDETALYYGFDGKPDYPAALQCGWYERAHPQTSRGTMFYGPGVLAMLYANGLGVPRNPAAAIRFACEQEWAAPAEMESRIGHLEYLSRPHNTSSKFDLCDDITSGLSMGFCTRVQTSRADVVRNQEIGALVSKLPEAAKSAFLRLQSAQVAFEESRAGNEIDLSGTARGMFQLEEEKKLRDQFLVNLQRFGKAEIPAATSAELAALDRQLNLTYRQIQEAPADAWRYGTIKPEGIRDSERKWLALSDAWLDFAHAAYPNVTAASIRAQLIRLRLHQLRSLQQIAN